MSFARTSALLVLLFGDASMTTPSRAQEATSIVLDAGQSSASFIVHMRIRKPAEGKLTKVSGQLRGTPATGWEVLVKVDGSSLHLAGPRWMERVTRSDAFLAVDRFPAIGFDSEHFSDAMLRTGGPLRGQLTLRGLTRPVSFQLLPSACDQPGRDCDIQVQGTISRHAFGMNAYRALVKDNVDFHIRARLQPTAPAP